MNGISYQSLRNETFLIRPALKGQEEYGKAGGGRRAWVHPGYGKKC
ncbi:hypothetical protein HMPREF9413_3696 [Paenibacillus sp. HGF7]|nr:hypothetical protein HMPREF9413_3696 [Paenibacillus sp. HGF7]